MRKILFILLMLPFMASAQRVRYIIVDSTLGIPQDTFRIPTQYRDLPQFATRHDTLYVWDKSLHYWRIPAGGGSTLTPSTNINITGTTIKTTDSLVIVSGGEPSYYFRHRLSGLGFPVATVKPTASGNMAFDIMPFGSPGNYSDNGIAWIDVCDANVVGASTGSVVTARAGVTNTAVQLGMRAFGGASEKRLNIIMGTDSIMTFNTDRTIDVNTADFSISKNTSGNNIQWLINPNTGNSASIWIIAQDFAANKAAFIRYENEGQSGGSPYQQPNQVEFVTNTGATNGMVLGTLLSTAPTKIVAGSTERLRFSADSILWKTPQRVASTTWLLAYDSTTKNMSYIRRNATTPGIDDVLLVGQALTTSRTVDVGSNTLDFSGLHTGLTLNNSSSNTTISADNGILLISGFVSMSNPATSNDTTTRKILVYNTSTNHIEKANWSNSGGGTGTVTSVAAGYGMNFTTITSTGSVIADTTILAPKANQTVISGSWIFTGTTISHLIPTSTGTTTSSGIVETMNSLTSGTGHYISTNSLTSGSPFRIVSTSTVLAANNAGLTIDFTGANGTNNITAVGFSSSVANTNATSGRNTAVLLNATGATTSNRAIDITAGDIYQAGGGQKLTGTFSKTPTGDGLEMDWTSGTNTFNLVSFRRGSAAYGNIIMSSLTELHTASSGGANTLYLANGNVEVGSGTAATSSLHVTGTFALTITSSAVDINVGAHHTVLLTVTAKTATLPTAVGITGREYTIKLTVAGTGTVATTSSQTIDGSTTYSLASQYKYVTVQSDGSNWHVIANN